MHSASVIVALSALVAGAWAGAIGVSPLVATADVIGTASYPAYHSQYSVSDALTGDQKSHTETRDGDVTKGSYSLLQPDGVVRTVNYISTPLGGFQAQVINSGAAAHPAYTVSGRGGVGAIVQAAPIVAARPAVVAAAPLGINIGLGGLGQLGGLGGARSIITTQLGYGRGLGVQGGLLTSNGLVGNQGALVTSNGLGLVGNQGALLASNGIGLVNQGTLVASNGLGYVGNQAIVASNGLVNQGNLVVSNGLGLVGAHGGVGGAHGGLGGAHGVGATIVG